MKTRMFNNVKDIQPAMTHDIITVLGHYQQPSKSCLRIITYIQSALWDTFQCAPKFSRSLSFIFYEQYYLHQYQKIWIF